MRRKKISAQLVKRGSPEEKDFNINFWKNVSPTVKWEAAWDMTLDYMNFRGQNGGKSRLQRSIQTVKQRKG
jgi:hypothetical protein